MAESRRPQDSRELAEELARAAVAKLASEVAVLDMRELVSYTDYLVICSARNDRQADAIVEEVHRAMKGEHGLLPVNPGRNSTTEWTVLDYLDVVLHVFTGDARTTYDLEDLWYEAPRVDVTTGPAEGEPATG